MKKTLLLASLLIVGAIVYPHQVQAACGKDANAIRVITRDAEGTLLPGMNVAVYHKNTDPDGNPYLGASALASSVTDVGGQTPVICVSNKQSPYAVKVYQKNSTFGYFAYWDIAETGPTEVAKVDVNLGGWQVIFRDAQGTLLKDVVFDVYLQTFDFDGEPVIDVTKLNVDKLVASDFNTMATGAAKVYLTPGHYVIRIHGTGSSYFYLWNQEVNAETEDVIEYHLGTMRIVLEDGFGGLVKNRTFSVYEQDYDVRHQPIYGRLVASNLNTGDRGKVDAYLPGGSYAIKVNGTGGTTYNSWAHSIDPEEYQVVTYRLSGMRVVLRSANGELAHDIKFQLTVQSRDALNRPIPGKVLVKSQATGEAGFADLYVPQGTYMLLIGTQKQRLGQVDVFTNQFTSVDWPRTITFRPTNEIGVVSPLSNTNFYIRKSGSPRLPGLLGMVEPVSNAYTIKASKWRGKYTIVMTAKAEKLEELGIEARQLKIAFYNSQTKQWKLVGTRNTSKRQVSVTLKSPGTVMLVGKW